MHKYQARLGLNFTSPWTREGKQVYCPKAQDGSECEQSLVPCGFQKVNDQSGFAWVYTQQTLTQALEENKLFDDLNPRDVLLVQWQLIDQGDLPEFQNIPGLLQFIPEIQNFIFYQLEQRPMVLIKNKGLSFKIAVLPDFWLKNSLICPCWVWDRW